MKLFCIKDGPWLHAKDNRPADGPSPQYGDIVTVASERNVAGHAVVVLVEFSNPFGYLKKWFVPLSDIDETEMVREKQMVEA